MNPAPPSAQPPPENNPMLCWENSLDQFVPSAGIPPSDRGFRYGMSIFESLRLQDGHLHFAKAHWERLLASALHFKFQPPKESAFHASLHTLSQLSGSWFVRWYLSAGDGPPTAPFSNPRLWLLAETRPRLRQTPIPVGVHPGPFPLFLSGLKTGNYWPRIETLRAVQNQGFAECLLFNSQDQLVGAACSNVFVHLPNTGWITPPLSTGARNGVVREWILRQPHSLAREAILSSAQLQTVDAALLCNSWTGPLPVSKIGNRPLSQPQEIDLWTQRFESESLQEEAGPFQKSGTL